MDAVYITFNIKCFFVTCIQVAFCFHSISNNNGVSICFYMIVIIRSDRFIIKNRITIYEHTNRHKFTVKKQTMLCSNQHIFIRHAMSNGVF